MSRTILCVGFRTDPTFEYSVEKFGEMSSRAPLVVDLSCAKHGFWAHYDEGAPTCRIRTVEIDLAFHQAEVSLYQRLTSVSHLIRSGTRAWRGFKLAEYFFERLLDDQFFDIIVNRRMAGWSNGTRPIHYAFLARLGLRVPPWTVTNVPETVQSFLAEHAGDVFVKSVSHHRTISSRFSKTHAGDLDSLPNSPVLFQKAIHGPDVRVHVIGQQCFAVRITSTAEDYRYPRGKPVEYAPTELPSEIAALCVEATKQMGLAISGMDFKICEKTGQWYCFEANPMPGYSHYDRQLGGRIAAALVRYLQNEAAISASASSGHHDYDDQTLLSG
jgi:hypothetical protein